MMVELPVHLPIFIKLTEAWPGTGPHAEVLVRVDRIVGFSRATAKYSDHTTLTSMMFEGKGSTTVSVVETLEEIQTRINCAIQKTSYLWNQRS